MLKTRDERRVVPRWRSSLSFAISTEALPLRSRLPSVADSQDTFAKKLTDWNRTSTLEHAIELVTAAVVLDRPKDALAAARFLKSSKVNLARGLEQVAEHVLGVSPSARFANEESDRFSVEETRLRIRQLRNFINRNPRNGIVSADLARHYLALGQTIKAEEAILRALRTHPDSRFILRAAARFFVHSGEFDRAKYFLNRSPRTKIDPWLIATDIAVSDAAGKTSRLANAGRALLDRGNHNPSQVTEVASALATLELSSGKTRHARQLFEQSLSAPNDNAIAQAEWATTRLDALRIDPELLATPLSYEARALDAFSNAAWKNVMHESRRWLNDEPFSTGPVLLGSFVSAVALNQCDESVRMVRQGLRANPTNFALRNNLVFALTCAGRLAEAQTELQNISIEDAQRDERIALIATTGLLEFRLGHPEAGRTAYEKAYALAHASQNEDSIASLLAFWAREEVTAKTELAEKVFAQATDAIHRNKNRPGIAALEEMLLSVRPKR